MFSKKIFCVVLYLFAIQLHSQNNPIQFSSTENTIKSIETLLLQKKSFGKDTMALKKHLHHFQKTKLNGVIYEAFLANGYSDYYNARNTKSDFHYQQSIKKASALKDPSLEIWTQLNYVYYLYHNREYAYMTPLLLKLIDKIEKRNFEQLILPGESFKKIGWMMQTLADYENALHYLNLAKKHTPKNTAEYAAILDAIGLNYLCIENFKEAESYFRQVALLATQIDDKVRYGKALGNLAVIKQNTGDLKEAIALINTDLKISESENSEQNTLYAAILLTEMYVATENWNKAEETLQKAQDIVHLKSYFKREELKVITLKLTILKHQNNTDGELILRRRLHILEDSLKNKDSDLAISNSNWLLQKAKFNQKVSQAEDQFKHESAMKNIYAVIILLVLILGFVLFQNFKKQLKTKQLLHQQKIILFELEKIKTEKKLLQAHESLNSQVKYLKDKNSQIKKLKTEIQQIKESSSNNAKDKTGKLKRLLESHLMTENNWNTFKKEFQKEHYEFYRMLEDDFPEITDSNKRILLLEKLDFSKNEIAGLLGVTPGAIKKSKQRLKKKIGDRYDILFNNVKF
ncbi:tetratricopeptide repeat protein [Winogradskyella costae]|uniref:tetratricopeptide repeat protein n=1 Tax=Winogradskyella costae TaxID=2697008 RepID=UPI0015C8347F|nr:tetratricopeptide repeat protein [Winogradskyella costae]